MIDTRLWSSTPFNNPTALIDLMGMIQLFHVGLTRQVALNGGRQYPVLPLGSGPLGREWLGALQQQYQDAAVAVGIAPPPDLQTYDLNDASDFASWTFAVGQFSRQLAAAAGLP